jgi:hypothetical protein
MIEKFTRGKQSVRLRDLADHGPQENIFAVDSLSLVIGNNGAGKTRLLDAMWNAIKGTPSPDEEWNWEPHFHPGTCPSTRNVGVVYFSHSPNREPKGKGTRWIDASPSKTARPSNEALFGYEDYVKDITSIDPRFEVSLRARPLRLLRDLLWMMLKSELSLRHCSEDLNRDYAQLDVLYRQDAAHSPKPPPPGALPDFDRQLYAVAEGLMAELAGWLSAAELSVMLLDLELVRRRGYAYQTKLKAAYDSMFAPYPPWAAEDSAHSGAIRSLLREAYGENVPAPTLERVAIVLAVKDRDTLLQLQGSELSAFMEFKWQGVSSGQWALVTQCIQLDKALSAISHASKLRNVLVLIDEGDAFLHLDWQRQYIFVLNKMLAKMKKVHRIPCLQVVLATHSPLLATDVPRHYVNRLRDGNVVGAKPAFGAPLQTLLNDSFGASSIGEHAMRTLQKTIRNLAKGESRPLDQYVRSIIDDPIIAREFERLFGQGPETDHAAVDQE